jgi:hypothetical protein
MRISKINEANATYTISEWLIKGNQILTIKSRKENLHWGFILSTVVEYKHELLYHILTSYFPTIMNYCLSILDF